MFDLKFVDPIDMDDEDDEEIIQLILAMLEEENQTKTVKISPSKMVEEPPIIFNLCGAKFEIEK